MTSFDLLSPRRLSRSDKLQNFNRPCSLSSACYKLCDFLKPWLKLFAYLKYLFTPKCENTFAIQFEIVRMEKKKGNISRKKKPKTSDKESIAELKKKIQHQKDALNKIIKKYSK